jgi:hypothetical protein
VNAADAYRAKIKEKTFDLALPSGNTVKVILPPLHTWIAMGQVPPFFLKSVTQLWSGASEENLMLGLTPEEELEIMRSFCELVMAACIEPRVVAENPGEGEIAILEMPAADRDRISAWCLAGGPGLAVSVSGGEVEPQRLEQFPDLKAGHTTAENSARGQDLRLPAERIA